MVYPESIRAHCFVKSPVILTRFSYLFMLLWIFRVRGRSDSTPYRPSRRASTWSQSWRRPSWGPEARAVRWWWDAGTPPVSSRARRLVTTRRHQVRSRDFRPSCAGGRTRRSGAKPPPIIPTGEGAFTVHWLPLATSSVWTGTWLQRDFFALKSLTTMLESLVLKNI